MATVNIGNIKFNWKGAWSNSTTYAVDDVVSHSGSSYISIQAGSNQNPASASAYWQQMSSAGTNGTNGTDISTTLTTQGDILYRDGSGLQRLPKGTAGQVLQMNSSANAPEYGTLSSDFVKISQGNFSNVTYLDLDGTSVWGTAGTYKLHRVVFDNYRQTESSDLRIRMLNSGTQNTSGDYSWCVQQTNSSSTSISGSSGDADNMIQITRDQIRGDNNGANYINFEVTVGHVNAGVQQKTLSITSKIATPNQDGSVRLTGTTAWGISRSNDGNANTNRTGLRFYPVGGYFYGTYTIYGMKA